MIALKPLHQQFTIAQWMLIASLTTGSVGLLIGAAGTAKRSPVAILLGYSLFVPSLCTGLMGGYASREVNRRLAVARKDQAAIDQQIKQAWQQGHESGRTETLNEIDHQPPLVNNGPELEKLRSRLTLIQGELTNAQELWSESQDLLGQTQSELANTITLYTQNIKERDQTINQLQKRLETIDEETRRLESLRSQLQSEKESQHHRELTLARNEGQVRMLESQIAERDRRQNELERQLTQLNEEYSQALIQEHQSVYQQGIEQAAAAYSLELEKSQATIAKLQARLDKLHAYDSQNRALSTLSKLIGKTMKPAFITAGQGAGKALHTAELCRIWSESAESACVFVLDISEGGSKASSWSRMGIPVTDDPALFIAVLGAVVAKMSDTGSELPWRNNPDEYKTAPPIVLVIDEALTAFDNQTNGRIQAVIDGLAAIESRGSKRKVFCIACSTDDQIQNISATSDKGKTMKLWNTGRLKNYYRLYLNDAVLHRATDDELKANQGLANYISTYGGSHFIAALESFDGKGKFLKPFKHVSHHGHLLHETKPSYAPSLKLSCPDWFPEAARGLFPPDTTKPTPPPKVEDHNEATVTPHQNLEALLELDCGDHPTEGKAQNPDIAECPHCHTIGKHRVHSRDKRSRVVKRWKCRNRQCGKTFKA